MTEHEKRLQDIKEHPERHRHDFNGLQACCFVDGAIDMALIEAHGEYASLGTNGGNRCDVIEGPCACGAWHKREDWTNLDSMKASKLHHGSL